MADPLDELMKTVAGDESSLLKEATREAEGIAGDVAASEAEQQETRAAGPDVETRRLAVVPPEETSMGSDDIKNILMGIADIGLPVKGAILTKAIGSKL